MLKQKRPQTPTVAIESWGYIFRALNRALEEGPKSGQKGEGDWEAQASFTRADIYERGFAENLRQLVKAIPGMPMPREFSDEQLFVRMIRAMHEGDATSLFAAVGNPTIQMTPELGVLALAMQASQRAFIAFGYTINELLAHARRGSDEALIQAVRVDASVLGGRTAGVRLARAVREADRRFFARLAEAIRKPGKLDLTRTARLNAAMRMLALAGVLDLLNPASAYQLFVRETRLYPAYGNEDAESSLWRKVQRFKQTYATRFPEKVSSKKR